MPKIEVTRTELVWPGKYDEEGNLVPPRRVNLPFQVIERVNETRATREKHEEDLAGHVGTLFDYWRAEEEQRAAPGDGWRNKLIWGDNLYVMGSLLEHFAGKIDLIYIDPPFATGADFSYTVEIGEAEVTKSQSAIEEKAYRDTWGGGSGSFLNMLYERARLMRDLLSSQGLMFLHVGQNVSSHVRVIMDEVFGPGNFRNQIIWKRTFAHGNVGQGTRHLGPLHDVIFLYAWSYNRKLWIAKTIKAAYPWGNQTPRSGDTSRRKDTPCLSLPQMTAKEKLQKSHSRWMNWPGKEPVG